MDLSCCLWSFGTDLDGPCSCFVFTGCEEAHQAKKVVACFHQFLKSGFCQSQIFQEHLLFIVIQLGNLFFDLSTDYEDLTVLLCSIFAHCLHMLIAGTVICQVILCNIGCIDHRFPGKKIISSHPSFFVLILKFHCDGHLAIFQMSFYFLEEIKFLGSFFIHTCCLGHFGNSSLQDLQVREDQLQVNGLNITERINASIYMDHIGILEAAYYMNNRIYFTDICQELVSKTFTLGSTLYKSCDIYEFNNSRCYFLGMIEISQKFQSLIRYCNYAHIRVDGTERIVRRFCAGLGQ